MLGQHREVRELDGIAGRFLALHHADQPLLQPNAWDAGSARVLAALGFEAIATTSSGFAATLGRLDGTVTRNEVLAHVTRVARVSVGGAFAYAALAPLVDAGTELRDDGTYGWWGAIGTARTTIRSALGG